MGIWDGIVNGVNTFGKKLDNSLYPDAPAPIADTPAGKAATTYADKLVNAQGQLPAPTYGSAQQVQVSKPMAPDQSDYDIVSGKVNPTTGAASAGGVAPVNVVGGGGANGLYKPIIGDQTTSPTPPGSLTGVAPGAAQAGIAALHNTDPNASANPADAGGTGLSADESLAKQKAAAQARIDKYNADLAQYNAIYGADAQQSNTQVDATSIAAPTLGTTPGGMQAPSIGAAPQLGGAPQIGALPQVSAQQVNAPGAIQAGSVTAQQIGPQSMAKVGDIGTDSLGRNAQIASLNDYANVANGTAPSAAQALLRKGIDENVGAQLGMAATLQGNTPGLALRSGLSGAANAIAKSSADMAALRAQEQETGRAGFLTAATGIRAADIQIAQSNQTKDLTTSVQTMQANLDSMKANQQAALSAGQSNVAADLQAKITTASNQLDAAKTNAANSLSADVANLTAKLDASKANQAAQVQQNIANLNSQLTTATANLQSALQTGMANEANKLQSSIAQMNAQLDAAKANQQALLDAAKANQQNSQFNAGLGQQQNQFESGLASTNAQQNADRALAQQTINNNLYNNETQNATNALGVPLGVAQSDLQKYLDWQKANGATTAGLIGGGASTAGKLIAAL